VKVAGASILAALAFGLAGSAPAAEPELPKACSDTALAADIASCDQAIASESEPVATSLMLYRRAYALVEKFRYEDALKDLDAALALRPDFADALHERGYVHGELSELDRALEDLNREIAIRPDRPDAYQERAYVRHWAADFAGAWADRDRQVALQPGDPDLLLARADEAIWLGRFDDATRDVAAAEALAQRPRAQEALQRAEKTRQRIALLQARTPGGSPAERCAAAEKDSKLDRPGLIGDCTAAFLAASSNEVKADSLTTRSLAWLVQQQDSLWSTVDRRIAAALDPGNADRHANVGFAYLNDHHSWAAEREFDRALQIREKWTALAGRAAARYNLGRKDEALADAKRSVELEQNELAFTVLGDLSFDRNDKEAAKRFWMAAYHLGDRDDGLITRLRRVGVEHPESEPRQ
jgi:tetratricopeptide (TPR) repeat protein